MKVCPDCNLENPDHAQRCAKCGADLPATDADDRVAMEVAWAQRERLNDLAFRLEDQLGRKADQLGGKPGMWHDALAAIGSSQPEAEEFLFNLSGLFRHVKRYYPLEV